MTTHREKTLINSTATDPNKILPMKYAWARTHYKNGVANNWTPEEVNMQKDVEMWRSPTRSPATSGASCCGTWASSPPRRASPRTTSCSPSTGTSPTPSAGSTCCGRRTRRRSTPTPSSTAATPSGSIRTRCTTCTGRCPSIQDKDQFVIEITRSILDPAFTTEGTDNVQRFVHDLVGYYVIMEGIFFYAGFVMMLSFLRQNKMVGVGEQFQFILRDESVHLAFGTDLINTIVHENPEIWTEEFKRPITENIASAVDLEHEYAKDCLPRGILGLNADAIREYVEYIADRRLERIGLAKLYGAETRFRG